MRPDASARINGVTGWFVLLLGAAAAFIAARFRAMPPPVDLRQMTWDAASHALIGLDIYDHVRRLEPLRLVLRLQEEHWWPPLFGFLSLPAYAIAGRQVSAPSLVSFAAYCLIPVFVWLAIRKITAGVPLVAAALAGIFVLRSPQLIEMSTWSMLEPAATLFVAAALFCFLGGPQSRTRNWAYGLAGASALFKYHYGFFLLVTFGIATVMEMHSGEQRDLARSIWRFVRRKAFLIALLLFALAIIASSIIESPRVPSVANLIYVAYMTTLITMVYRISRSPEPALPDPIRRFAVCGLPWLAISLIDPANLKAWYRQLTISSEDPAQWTEQIRAVFTFMSQHYFVSPVALWIAVTGFLIFTAGAIRRRRIDLLAVTLHAIWPPALMTLSDFRIEQRFLSTTMVAFFLAAAAGWTLLLAERSAMLRYTAGAILLGILIADQTANSDEWREQLSRRRVYHYASSEPPDRFVRETVASFDRGEPVLIVLPRDIYVVAPTVRLGLRLALPDVAPHEIIIKGGGLAQRLRRFDGGYVGADVDRATLEHLAGEAGLRVVNTTDGPAFPERPDRRLLIARVVPLPGNR